MALPPGPAGGSKTAGLGSAEYHCGILLFGAPKGRARRKEKHKVCLGLGIVINLQQSLCRHHPRGGTSFVPWPFQKVQSPHWAGTFWGPESRLSSRALVLQSRLWAVPERQLKNTVEDKVGTGENNGTGL